MRKFILAVYTVTLLLPGVAAAAPRSFQELANQIVVLINSAVIVLVVAAFVIYLGSIVRGLKQSQEKGGEMLRTYALWGIAIIFVMTGVWGIIQILQNSLFGSGAGGAGGGGGQQFQSGFSPPSFGP